MDDLTIGAATPASADPQNKDDLAAEARVLLTLGQALLKAERKSEGLYICRQAARLAFQIGDRSTQERTTTALGMNLEMLQREGGKDRRWIKYFGMDYCVIESCHSFESARGGRFYEAGSQKRIHHFGGERLLVDLAVGYVACKFLGSFTEAFAAKLGERLGESTTNAIGRIRLLLDRRNSHRELDVITQGRTTLVLPEDFTDEAKLAAIELDVTADGIRGAVLHWNAATSQWLTTRVVDPDGVKNPPTAN